MITFHVQSSCYKACFINLDNSLECLCCEPHDNEFYSQRHWKYSFFKKKKIHRRAKNHLQGVKNFIAHQTFIRLFRNTCILCIQRISVGTFKVGTERDALRSSPWPLPWHSGAEVPVMATTCGQTWSKASLQFLLIFLRVEIFGDCSMCSYRLAGLCYKKYRVFHDKRIANRGGGFKNGGWDGMITAFIVCFVPSLYTS